MLCSDASAADRVGETLDLRGQYRYRYVIYERPPDTQHSDRKKLERRRKFGAKLRLAVRETFLQDVADFKAGFATSKSRP